MALLDSSRIYKVLAASVWPYTENTETYGTEVPSNRIETFQFTPEYDTDTGRDFGVKRDLLSVLVGEQLQVTHVGFNANQLEALTGRTLDESESPVGNRARRSQDGDDHPYIGFGVVLAVQGGGSVLRMYPRVKLMGDSGMTLNETNQFVRPQLTMEAASLLLADGTRYDIWYEEEDDGILTLDSDFQTALDALRTRTTA